MNTSINMTFCPGVSGDISSDAHEKQQGLCGVHLVVAYCMSVQFGLFNLVRNFGKIFICLVCLCGNLYERI